MAGAHSLDPDGRNARLGLICALKVFMFHQK